MINLKNIGLILFCLLVISCQKDELPEGTTDTPQFTSTFDFNGQAYQLSAGEMGLVQTSVSDTSGGGIVLTGRLTNTGCADCGPGFKLTVHSPQGYNYTSNPDLLSDLSEWDYALNPDQDSTYILDLFAASGNPLYKGDWYLDGEQLNASPVDSIHFQLDDPGNYSLLFHSNQDPCDLSVSRAIEFDGQTIPCYGNIYDTDTMGYYFEAIPGESFNPNTTTYTWLYADSSISTGSTNYLSLDNVTFINQMCVEMTDSEGCQTTVCTDFVNSPAVGMCKANILLGSPVLIAIPPEDGSARTVLEITDNSGTAYSSENGSQSNSIVTLLSAENYTEPTMPDRHFLKVRYQIDCLLYDASENGYPFSGTIVTAFEIP